MAETKTARRYASALFELAKDADRLTPIWADLKTLLELIRKSPELDHFLKDPQLSSERRASILHIFFKETIDPLVYTFLLFIDEKHRIDLLESMCTAFDELYYEYKNILKVKIISARDLTDAQVRAIEIKLKEKFHSEIESRLEIDPTLLGGFKIIVGDQVIDFSLMAQLHRIKHNIINA